MASDSVLINALKKAITGESNAKLKYQEYSKIALKEGFKNVAYLFSGLVVAEQIHIKNHTQGLRVIDPQEGNFKPTLEPKQGKTTKENVEDAIAGETHEFKEMYPGLIAETKGEHGENADVTRLSFNWARKVEWTHQEALQLALKALIEGHDIQLEEIFICRVCGNLRLTKSEEVCPVCGHDAEFYTAVKRPEVK